MQINLIPKTREQEQKKKEINSIIIIVSVSFLVATGIIAFVIYSVNVSRKNEVKAKDKKIAEVRSDIDKFKDVEEYVSSLVSKSADVDTILRTRKDINKVLYNLQALFPREISIGEFSANGTAVSFKLKAVSYAKLAETIKALEDYEAQIDIKSELDNKEEGTQESVALKVKMFNTVDVSMFSKFDEEGKTFYGCDIVATISEAIWL